MPEQRKLLIPSSQSIQCNFDDTITWCKFELIDRIGKERAKALWNDRNKLFAEAAPIRQFELVISWFFSIKERIGICDHLWQVEMAYRHSNKEPPQSLARLFAEIQLSRANNDK